LPLSGQFSLRKDTIKINEVLITGQHANSNIAGYKKTAIDSMILKNFNHGTLAEILSETSNIFIKSYGASGTATPSFRGTGAGHTLISWNGINLNSPMLGQSDLSLLPIGMIDAIQVYFGGASMTINNGGIGGIINLETKPVWKKETLFSLDAGFGSFGRYSGLVKVKGGSTNIQSVTKLMFQSSENNFRYLNSDFSALPRWETRINSQVQERGFVQELYYRIPSGVTSAKIWYQSANRNLPASILTQTINSGEKQFDEALRTMLNYDNSYGKTDYFITGAWVLNNLNYYNRLADIDSRNISQTTILKTGIEKSIGKDIKLKVVINEEYNSIRSNNYNRNVTNSTTVLTTSAERKKVGRIGSFILFREIYNKNTFLIPDFSAGLQFRIIKEKEYFLKGNISRNSKIPTMNDMYWFPGGNPDLKNEYAFIYEFSYEMVHRLGDPLDLKYDASVFYNNIKNMIQWHPGQYSYWTADNIRNVNSRGLESSVSLDYSDDRFNCKLNAAYSFTRAEAKGLKIENDMSAGKQLMYIPENQINASFRIGFNNIYSSWIVNYAGKRYTSVDNSKFLPEYCINNIGAGIKLPLKAAAIDMSFNIDNLFDVIYQSIVYYPLPGRSFFLRILIQLIK